MDVMTFVNKAVSVCLKEMVHMKCSETCLWCILKGPDKFSTIDRYPFTLTKNTAVRSA